MTSASNDMPPRQPSENEPADHPVRDELDIIDEAVARITDAEVDEHLRQVLDRAGYRSRHAHYAQTPPGTLERPAAARRGRPFSRVLIILSGAAPGIVDKVPAERAKFESRGLAVFLSSAIAVVSMWFTLTTAAGINGIPAAPAGLLWGLVIMGIDRWLVTSMPLGGSWRGLAGAVPRLMLALLLGALISTPIVLHLFQQPINTKISALRQQQLSAQLSALSHQVTSRQAQVSDLSEVIAFRGQASLAPSADLQLQSLNAAQTSEIALGQQYIQEMACVEFGDPSCQTPLRPALAYLNAWNHWKQASAKVSRLANQIKTREEQLITPSAAAVKTRLEQARETLPAVEEELTAAQEQLTALRETFRTQNTAGGVLIRLESLNQLDPAARSASLLLFLLLLMIECLPVTVALVQRPGGYEKILAHMIIDERLNIAPDAPEPVRQPTARQEEHLAPLPAEVAVDGPGLPEGTPTAQYGSEPVTVPDHLRNEIESIYPFMKDTTEKTAPAYREELENFFLSISQAVNELRRKGFDSDQIAEALRITAGPATRQLAAAWQETLERKIISLLSESADRR